MDTKLLLDLHHLIGNTPFILVSLIVASVFCFKLIPYTTDLMTNSAAGLTKIYLGAKWETIVINSTTNIPELLLMLIALIGFRRLGGIATPLGSNFANIYLMFLLAPLWIFLKWTIQGEWSRFNELWILLQKEKKLVIGHLLISFIMLSCAIATYRLVTGVFPVPFSFKSETIPVLTQHWPFLGSFICLVGIGIFFFFENQLMENYPELQEDFEDNDFDTSWTNFFLGTLGVIACCYILNVFFVTWSQLYSPILSQLFGTAIFKGLHFFVGSFISSVPEIHVAIKNYQVAFFKFQDNNSPTFNLHIGLGSASVSNMSNLAIAVMGIILSYILLNISYINQ